MNRDDLTDLLPAYALGALDPDEQAMLEAWLRDHPEAQALLDEYRQVSDHLAALAPLRPAPSHLQADLRQRLAASRNAAPIDESHPATPAPLTLPQGGGQRTLRQVRRWRRIAMLAAAAVVLVTVGVLALLTRDEEYDPEEMYHELTVQTGSSLYTVVPGEVNDAVVGDLVVGPEGDEAVIRVEALPAIGEDQTFQLWLVDQEGNRVSGGLFRPETPEAPTYVKVPLDRPVAEYQAFGVSLEPEGGSPLPDEPTGPRVFSIPLGS